VNRFACSDATMVEGLLEVATRGGSSFSLEQLRHLEACEGCRTSVERTRRLAATWRRLAPSSAELSAACARFESRTPRRGRARAAPSALVLAVLLAAAAASGGIQIAASRRSAPAFPTLVGPPPAGVRALHPSTVAMPKPALSPAPAPLAALDSITIPSATPPHRVVPLALSPHPLAASPALSPSPPLQSEVAPLLLLPLPAPPASGLPVPPPPPPPSDVPPAVPAAASSPVMPTWTAAAAAMRAGDYARAEEAFTALAATSDAHTRDAARLARAQLWLSEGRVAGARAELESLIATGATALIRQSAADALRRSP
jgi:hypothetical protein